MERRILYILLILIFGVVSFWLGAYTSGNGFTQREVPYTILVTQTVSQVIQRETTQTIQVTQTTQVFSIPRVVYKCYHWAYLYFISHPGSILVFGIGPGGGEHAWIEEDGKVIDGNWKYDGIPSNYKVGAKCYYADEWLWIISKWDAGLGVGAVNDSTGVWWVSEDNERYIRRDLGVQTRRS